MKTFVHIGIVAILTIVTQIGGIIWIFSYGYFKISKRPITRWKKLFSFSILYLISTLLIVPALAKLNGRVPLPITKPSNLIPHNYITPLLNRHYVKRKLRDQLYEVANEANFENMRLKLSYLDANLPFRDGFPLLPHLSHNDGRKVDLSVYYTQNNEEGNLKPSNTGYGFFVEPRNTEFNQSKECKLALRRLVMSPAAVVLHYSQTIFEGLKAYRTPEGGVNLFRPQANIARMNHSAHRMCMPQLPEELFLEALVELVRLDRDWLPTDKEGSLYIRPFMFASDEYIGVKPSDSYKFIIFTCPAQAYYQEPVRVKIETTYSRAFPGGTGETKCGGNYAGGLYPAKLRQDKGFHQLVWTDGLTQP